MRWLIRALGILLFTLLVSYTPLDCSDELFTVVYTVLGIMFSIALSQLISFSFSEVENKAYVNRWRGELAKIRIRFIVLFALSTTGIILIPFGSAYSWKWVKFDTTLLIFVFLIFCLGYFIVNFIDLAKLKDDIDDEIRDNKAHNPR